MKRVLLLSALGLMSTLQVVHAQQPSKPKEELKCDPNNKDEYKESRYYHNGKLHVEYCFNGKKYINIDHGENG